MNQCNACKSSIPEGASICANCSTPQGGFAVVQFLFGAVVFVFGLVMMFRGLFG